MSERRAPGLPNLARMALNAQLADQRLAVLRTIPGLSAAGIDALEVVLKDPDDWRPFRLNPLRFAEEHGLSSRQAVDLMLHAVRSGLLELRFNLICPGCGSVEYHLRKMDAVPQRDWFCVMCQRAIAVELDDRVEVSFSPELGIRELRLDIFGSPQNYGRFYFSENFVRSPEFQALIESLTLGVFLVPSGETAVFTIEARAGEACRLVSLDSHSQVLLTTAPGGAKQVELTALAESLSPKEVLVGEGLVELRVVNRAPSTIGFLAMRVDFETAKVVLAKHPVSMRPFLTAKQLLNSQTFRDLFRVQALDADMQLRLRSLTLLFTDLKGSTELYDRTGDIRAYTFVREHFKVLAEAVKRHNGALVKTMGDAIMASFNEPTDAANAALEMMAGMSALNAGLKAEGHETGLKVGLHEGPALAVTAEERLDYFGQTVNVAARVQGLAQVGEIWLTPSVLAAPGVAPAFERAGWASEERQVTLKGVGGNTRVVRLSRAETH